MTTILEEAEALVNGTRQAEYGPPFVNMQRTADIWSAVLGAPVTPRQVCLCMAGLKLARAANGDARDSLVDLAGYVRLVEMCEC